jgi:hypothetical protein
MTVEFSFTPDLLLILAAFFNVVAIAIAIAVRQTGGFFWWLVGLLSTVIWATQLDEPMFYLLATLLGIAQIIGFIFTLKGESA